MLTVHLRINDPVTKQPTPVRLAITGPDGESYHPLGRSPLIPSGRYEALGGQLLWQGKRWAIIDGACEIRLPAEVPLLIEVSKGPEYVPLAETVTLGPGQLALRYTLERHCDLAAEGWYSGDTRCHGLSPHDALVEGEAEGIRFINLLAHEVELASLDGKTYPHTSNLLAFSGQKSLLGTEYAEVIVNTHNVHPALGRLALLHTHRPVFPLQFGFIEANDDWSLHDWCEQGHRKKGLTIWTHPFAGQGTMIGGEALLCAHAGQIDAIEYDGGDKRLSFLPHYYRLLNAGIRLPLVGASGKESNRTPIGAVRTYAHVEGEITYPNWIEAIRRGCTFVTTGPLVRLRVDGRQPGECLQTAGPLQIEVDRLLADADKQSKIEVVANGTVIGHGTDRIAMEYLMPQGGWIAARVWQANHSKGAGQVTTMAHTSPIWVQPPGQPPRRDRSARPWLQQAIDEVREWANQTANYTDTKWRMQLLARCDAAEARVSELL